MRVQRPIVRGFFHDDGLRDVRLQARGMVHDEYEENWIFVLQPLRRRFALHRRIRQSHCPGNPNKSHCFNSLDDGVKRRDARSLHVVTVYVASSLTELSVRDYLLMEGFSKPSRWRSVSSIRLSFHNGISYTAHRQAWLPVAAGSCQRTTRRHPVRHAVFL